MASPVPNKTSRAALRDAQYGWSRRRSFHTARTGWKNGRGRKTPAAGRSRALSVQVTSVAAAIEAVQCRRRHGFLTTSLTTAIAATVGGKPICAEDGGAAPAQTPFVWPSLDAKRPRQRPRRFCRREAQWRVIRSREGAAREARLPSLAWVGAVYYRGSTRRLRRLHHTHGRTQCRSCTGPRKGSPSLYKSG